MALLSGTLLSFLSDDLREIEQSFRVINESNDVETPLWLSRQSLLNLQNFDTRVEVSSNFFIPKAIEIARFLRRLRQRLPSATREPDLVGRMRAEVRPRERPIRDQRGSSLQGELGKIASIGGSNLDYSQFQVDGWKSILNTMQLAKQGKEAASVITASTGAGKTEVFLLSLLYEIGNNLRQLGLGIDKEPRFVVIYPRTALAQDQIARVFKYAREAEKQLRLGHQRIIVGLQFTGIYSQLKWTKEDKNVFENQRGVYEFQKLEACPWNSCKCRLILNERGKQTFLQCPQCNQDVFVTLSKESHNQIKPHLMITTAESLDRMYLDWNLRDYLPLLHGIVLDEAHLFIQLYGAHVYQLLQRVRQLALNTYNRELGLVAVSATIDDPGGFAQRLFFRGKNPSGCIDVIDANSNQYRRALAGLEVLYFLQAQDQAQPLSTMIQTAMAMGHGALTNDRRMIIFASTLDLAGRLDNQLEDAEKTRELWRMRMDTSGGRLAFKGNVCPQVTPFQCGDLYLQGECWRGALGGVQCSQRLLKLNTKSLEIQRITGKTQGSRALRAPIVIGTSALEVGIDDPQVQATLHYRPPRTVFEFIQRRGRAGRKYDDYLAYTTVVLGHEPSDFFYLTRRHRLIDGDYELPLNPDNPVVTEVHEWLRKAREELFSAINSSKGKIQQGIWDWIKLKLTSCPYLSSGPQYGQVLNTVFQGGTILIQRSRLQKWIDDGLEDAKNRLQTELAIPERQRMMTIPELIPIMDELVVNFNEWQDGMIDSTELDRRLEQINQQYSTTLQNLITTNQYPSNRVTDETGLVTRSLIDIKSWIQGGVVQRQQTLLGSRIWFDFFTRLKGLYAEARILNTPFDVVRIVYQAMYIIHRGLSSSGSHTCPINLSVYVPDTFFESTRNIRVEIPSTQRIETEAINNLVSVFYPYRISYRYEQNALYILETRKIWVDRTVEPVLVRLQPGADGPVEQDVDSRWVRRVSGIRVREIDSDVSQRVGLCRWCYQIYGLAQIKQNTTCSCGGPIQEGNIYVYKAIVDSEFRFFNSIQISTTFELAPELKARTVLRGSEVSFRGANRREHRFNAQLEPALYYEVDTKGIVWRVPNIPSSQKDEWFHAAAHVLLKAMAVIVGVREDQLSYGWDEAKGVVAIWEKTEGGSGLCEIFQDILQRDPLRVYQEMVSTVACPVYLAEKEGQGVGKIWQAKVSGDLERYLSQQFGLDLNDPLLKEIATEALAETKYQSSNNEEVCSQFDGCPACVHALECRGDEKPRRSVAWTLVQSLIQMVPAAQWGTLSQPLNLVVKIDNQQGNYYVLVI